MTSELAILLRCACGQIPVWTERVNDSRLVEMACLHGLIGELAAAAPKGATVHELLVVPLAEVRARRQQRTEALEKIAGALDLKGIRFLSFRPASQPTRAFADSDCSRIADVDLLVAPCNWSGARHALLGVGLEAERLPPPSWVQPGTSRRARLGGGGVRVDLHHPLAEEAAGAQAFESVWGRRRDFPAGNRTVSSLGAADTIRRASLDGTFRAFSRLGWLANLASLAGAGHRESEWEYAIAISHARRELPAFLCGWSLLQSEGGVLPAPVRKALRHPPRRLKPIRRSCRREWNYGGATPLAMAVHQLRLISWRQRVRVVYGLIRGSGGTGSPQVSP